MRFDGVFIEKMKRLSDELSHKIGTWSEDPNREYGVDDLEDVAGAMREVEWEILKVRGRFGKTIRNFSEGEFYLYDENAGLDRQSLMESLDRLTEDGFTGLYKVTTEGLWVELK